MTPSEIITRAVQAIPGIRLPTARRTVERIMKDLDEAGFQVREKEKPQIGYEDNPPRRHFGGK